MDYVAHTPAQLGPILRGFRVERALTQQAAGAKVGLKQSTVSAVESDAAHTSVETLCKLLSALGLELVLRDKVAHNTRLGAAKKSEW